MILQNVPTGSQVPEGIGVAHLRRKASQHQNDDKRKYHGARGHGKIECNKEHRPAIAAD
jgi:hypothetical protein